MDRIGENRDKIIQGDCLGVIKTFPAESIDMVMTSPPYWALRAYGTNPQIWDGDMNCQHEWGIDNIRRLRTSTGPGATVGNNIKECQPRTLNNGNYCQKCGAWRGELGLEPTFDLYIKHLCDIFDEVKRVLRKDGTCWVNIGDSYGGSGKGVGSCQSERKEVYIPKEKPYVEGDIAKCLCQIPARFSIEMTNRGWILRNTIIWYKRNCMPSSVTDRFTVDFEYLFFFVKNKKYWFEQQTEPYKTESIAREMKGIMKPRLNRNTKIPSGVAETFASPRARYHRMPPIGGIKQCGGDNPTYSGNTPEWKKKRNKRCVWDITTRSFRESHFAVYPEQLCETPIKAGCPVGGIVLDPFSGAGTTALVAKKLGRHYIGIELSKDYCIMAEKRINNEAGLL